MQRIIYCLGQIQPYCLGCKVVSLALALKGTLRPYVPLKSLSYDSPRLLLPEENCYSALYLRKDGGS